MRVLHAAAYYAPAFVYGGPPRSIHGLCRALTDRGVDVEVFTTDANGDSSLPDSVTSAERYEGVRVRYFPRSWPLEPIGSRPLAAALRAALPAADVVHVHGLWNRVVWAAVREASRAGVPIVLSPRGMIEDGAMRHRAWRKRLVYAAIERHTLAAASVLHATSLREEATLRTLGLGARIVTIPNGVEVPAAIERQETGPVILFVGRLHPVKRLDLLLDAFAAVHARTPSARLVIAGPDECGLRGPLSARQPQVAPAIDWVGPVDAEARTRLLAQARMLVACSDSESFGMTVAEAMAAGRPVVVTRTCGWNAVEQADAGLVVDQEPSAIASAIGELLADPDRAEQMGVRGRALIQAHYTWPIVADAFLEVYRELT